MPDRLELTLPAIASSVGEMRGAVGRLGRSLGLSDARIVDLQLAVSEAVTNAVQHGGREGGTVIMKAATAQGELRISVADQGHGVRPRAGSSGLGLGLPVIAAVSDQLQVDTGSGGTTVTMLFRYP